MHLDVSRASVRLIRERLKPADVTDEHDGFLDDLITLDEEAQVIMRSLASGTGIPEGSMSADFRKAVLILEEAVQGFDIVPPARHLHFWAGKTRDDFLATTSPAPPVQPNPQGGFDFDPDRSTLIKRLEGRFEDVRDRADDILGRLEDGSMPCDGVDLVVTRMRRLLGLTRRAITDGRGSTDWSQARPRRRASKRRVQIRCDSAQSGANTSAA